MSTIMEEDIRQFKLVMFGEKNVGKSSIALRFVKDKFQERTPTPVNNSLLHHTVYIDDTALKFDICDTTREERSQLIPDSYKGADAAIVVYDIHNENSFNRAKILVKELQRQEDLPNIVIALTGNKIDEESGRVVKFREAKKFASKNNVLFMETSAKADVNINDLFLAIAAKLPKGDMKELTIVTKKASCCIC